MLDKRLYRDVSDLLELNVSDDKIIRIMMVRGFTTEQVRRVIKDIRSKAGMPEAAPTKALPVSETIETAPSKRFGMFNKLFGKGPSDDEVLAEEAAKLDEHENLLREEESRVNAEVEKFADAPMTRVPDDVREVLRMMDALLEKLPEKEIERFSHSPAFEKYRAVMRRYIGE